VYGSAEIRNLKISGDVSDPDVESVM